MTTKALLVLVLGFLVALGPPSVTALDVAADHARVSQIRDAEWRTSDGGVAHGVQGAGVASFIVEDFDMTHPDLDQCGDTDHHGTGALRPLPKNDLLTGHGNLVVGALCGSGEMSEGSLAGFHHVGAAPTSTVFSRGNTCIGVSGTSLDCDVSGWFREPNLRIWSHSVARNPLEYHEVDLQDSADVLLVQAVGNGGGDGDAAETPPWIGEDPRFLGVAAANGFRDGVASYSSRGARDDPATWPHVTAPGCMFLTAPTHTAVDRVLAIGHLWNAMFIPDDRDCPTVEPDASVVESYARGYILAAGTSFAAPFTAGIATLMFEVHPGLTALDAKFLLTRTADPFLPTEDADGDGRISPEEFHAEHGWEAGWGYVNATAAVAAAHYVLLHPDASPEEAVACYTVEEQGDHVVLNPDGGRCEAGAFTASADLSEADGPQGAPGRQEASEAGQGDRESERSAGPVLDPPRTATVAAMFAVLFAASGAGAALWSKGRR